MTGYQVEFIGAAEVDRGLANLDRRLSVLRPMYETFAEEFYKEEEELFATEPWEPLSDAYAISKAEQFGGKPLLRATDALYKSLTQPNAPGSIYIVDDTDAVFGSSDPKAILHQTGTRNMPARPPRAEPKMDTYRTLAGEYLVESLNESGFK